MNVTITNTKWSQIVGDSAALDELPLAPRCCPGTDFSLDLVCGVTETVNFGVRAHLNVFRCFW